MVVVWLFYVLLSILGFGLIIWRRSEAFLYDPLILLAGNWLLYLGACIALIVAVHLFSLWAVKRWVSLQESAKELNRWLGNRAASQIIVLVIVGGIGEELFFRGWLLNESGLFFSSFIFGIVHWPPNKNWRFWPIFAFVMGLILGALCLWTKTLIYAVIVHAGINYLNLRLLPGMIKG